MCMSMSTHAASFIWDRPSMINNGILVWRGYKIPSIYTYILYIIIATSGMGPVNWCLPKITQSAPETFDYAHLSFSIDPRTVQCLTLLPFCEGNHLHVVWITNPPYLNIIRVMISDSFHFDLIIATWCLSIDPFVQWIADPMADRWMT